ncbi:MAG: hypothetical protein HC897_01275 [Thermoanaerobaculia bacterium]|nr:hypothetical protein [Thermoanaerobaculia bacterium]
MALDIGVAFPLAFDLKSRQKFDDLLASLGQDLRERTGLDFDFFSISEALACVDAFGQANRDDHFLVADFGGSTLDVALYTSKGAGHKPVLHQLGSLEFAGETFIQAFAAAKQADLKAQEAFAWQVRDAIMAGECRERFGNEDAAQRVLSRFRAAAFEYLRTMAAAFSQDHPAEKVRLLLAGNAWHLSEAFDPSASSEIWRTVFRKTYRGMVARVGSEALELYDSPEMDALPSTKHYVVIGALNNAASSRKRRQLRVVRSEDPATDLDEVQIRLPAGRQLRFSKIGANDASRTFEWFHLVGEGAHHAGLSAPELRGAKIDFDLRTLPPPSASWTSYLLTAFKVDSLEQLPYPAPERLRAQIGQELTGDPEGYLGKGPLQLILEGHWKQELKKV